MRNALIVSTLVALATGPVAAQESGGQEAGTRIEATLQAAGRAEIPTSLLESKMKEGRAKGVPEERIAAALETRLEALVRARDALREAELEAVTTGELSVAADALQAGVSEEALVQISRSAPRERRLVATAVLGSLVELGMASDQARLRVRDALGRGPEALANLHAEVRTRLRVGGGGGPLSFDGRGVADGIVRLGGGSG